METLASNGLSFLLLPVSGHWIESCQLQTCSIVLTLSLRRSLYQIETGSMNELVSISMI